MKKTILLAALFAFTFSFQADAQMKVKKIGISTGQDWDMLPGLSHETLLSKSDGRTTDDMSQYFDIENSSQYSAACDNLNIRATLVLEPQRWSNVELHTSAVYIPGRMDVVYLQEGTGDDYRFLNVAMHGKELGLESTLLKKVPIFGSNAFNLYGGLGANAGYQFDNNLSVRTEEQAQRPRRLGNFRDNERFSEFANINDGVSARVFGQAGLGITFFRRIELGLEARYGAGFRHYFGTDTDFTNLHSIAVNLKYVLGAKE